MYPNPTFGKVTFEISKAFQTDTQIVIISSSGKQIYSTQLSTHQTEKEIDLSRFPRGIYLVRVISRDLIRSGKLILGN